MAFTLEKSYEDFGTSTTIAGEMASLSAELDAVKSDFGRALDTFDTACSALDFADWGDEVQGRLQAYLTEVMIKTAQTVKTSTDANVTAMKATVDSLESQLNTLAAKQEAYVTLKKSEPPKTITKYYDDKGYETSYLKEGGSSYSTDNPAWDEWDKQMYAATVVMDGMFGDINGDFASLASTTFDAANPSGAPAGGSSGDDSKEGETPTDSPVFDENGGEDGRHFSSKDDAIAAYMAANPGVSREQAESIINRRLKNATLFIPPDKVDEVYVAGEQLTEEAAMASGLAEPTEETVETTDPEHLGDTDDDGTENYRQGQHTDQEFETADGQTATRSEDLAISGEIEKDGNGEETLIPETATGEAHYETSDGETYTGDITVTYSNEGESFKKHEDITADKTGEQVAAVDQNQVRDYHSNNFGTDNNITDVTVEQGGMVTGKREQVEDYGRPGMRYVVSDEWSYVIPEEGKPVTEGRIVLDAANNPCTYSYERDDKGQLIETYTYPTRKGEQSQTRVVDEHVYLLRVTDPKGNVTETPIILDSQLGNAEFERQYQNAMIDVGWEARAMNHGMYEVRNGTNGSDPVIVKNINDENNEYVYQFEFIWPEDYW